MHVSSHLLPIPPNHRFPLPIQCESTHMNPIHFFPTQFQNSLVKQRASPTLHFSDQILITMLPLIRHNLNLLTTNNPLYFSFSYVTIQQYTSYQLFSRFLYTSPFQINPLPFIANTILIPTHSFPYSLQSSLHPIQTESNRNQHEMGYPPIWSARWTGTERLKSTSFIHQMT